MLNPLKAIEKFFYLIRKGLWSYPEYLFTGDTSALAIATKIYNTFRPYSHFVAAVGIVGIVLAYVVNVQQFRVFADNEGNKYIEGVVMGLDENGELQSLSKVNPLYPTLIQLERDLNEIIYEPLIIYEDENTVVPVLAEGITIIQEGADYEFELKSDVFWHDSTETIPRPFGVDDVLRTLEIINEIDTPDNLEISYVQAVKQMAWEKVGNDAIRICTTTPELQEALSEELQNKKCSGVKAEKPILANFLELISFKIMPAHLTGDLNNRNIFLPDPPINKRPIGTGMYKFSTVEDDSITLVRNDDYHSALSQIEQIEFRLFRDRGSVLAALQNGEIHAYNSSVTDTIREMAEFPQVNLYQSPVQKTQYWALYFNLRKDLDDNAVGPDFFQQARVRRAISAAINRERLLLTLLETGEEAVGPIPVDSEFFNSDATWERYNPSRAEVLLEREGWELDPNLGLRLKDNQILTFKLSFVDVPDRRRVVESIRQDLLEVGVEVVPDPRSLDELFNQVVSPKTFDALLYGMNTFIDPDRFELFHSEQSLNLSSYVGSEETVTIQNKETVRIPRVDRLLDRARSFDPVGAKDKRLEDYIQFQELLAKDAPVVFLYHPKFLYFVSSKVENISLDGAKSLEQRFVNIADWTL